MFMDLLGLAIYRHPGNQYGDRRRPGASGCEEPIYAGVFIVDWKPCDEEETEECLDGDASEPTPDGWPYNGEQGDDYPGGYTEQDDGLNDRWDDFLERRAREHELNRQHCIGNALGGLAITKLGEHAATGVAGSLGLVRTVAYLTGAGEVLFAYELTKITACVVRYPY